MGSLAHEGGHKNPYLCSITCWLMLQTEDFENGKAWHSKKLSEKLALFCQKSERSNKL